MKRWVSRIRYTQEDEDLFTVAFRTGGNDMLRIR